jgi:hypothetical protein
MIAKHWCSSLPPSLPGFLFEERQQALVVKTGFVYAVTGRAKNDNGRNGKAYPARNGFFAFPYVVLISKGSPEVESRISKRRAVRRLHPYDYKHRYPYIYRWGTATTEKRPSSLAVV